NPLLHVAIEAGRKDLACELLELGADAAAVNSARESSLTAALRRGWQDMVGPLVRSGADPNLPDREGMLPLNRALDRRDLPLARLLVQLGAGPPGGTWAPVLWDAYARRDLETCRLLLGLGVSPELRDGSGRRPAEAALAEGRADFLHLFLCYGAEGDSL